VRVRAQALALEKEQAQAQDRGQAQAQAQDRARARARALVQDRAQVRGQFRQNRLQLARSFRRLPLLRMPPGQTAQPRQRFGNARKPSLISSLQAMKLRVRSR
jgi:hypothetical protein